ncbi:MAG: ABC transporter substrate-binding protein [Gammaproteobacteria bacterium]
MMVASKNIIKIRPLARGLFWLGVVFFNFCLLTAAMAEQMLPVTVLYPDVQPPYRGVLEQIVAGITDETKNRVNSYPISDGFDVGDVRQRLVKQDGGVIVGLGRRGMEMVKALRVDKPVVIGAMMITPESTPSGFSGISLAPDPAILFGRLRQLAPQVKHVHLILNPDTNAWLIGLAREAARSQGLELMVYEARDIRAAARLYRDVFGMARGVADALWLPPDSDGLDERTVLPMVLQEAWERNVIVFSSNASHVKRGALFALYPDNYTMGRSLASMAMNLAKGRSATLSPLQDFLIAVNLRTAEHLNLDARIQQQRGFDLTFP